MNETIKETTARFVDDILESWKGELINKITQLE